MVWRTAEKKIIGTVLLVEEKPPVPVPIIKSFVDEHRRLKKTLDIYGEKGMCVTRDALEKESGITGERLGKHISLFEQHDVASQVSKDVLCGKSALKRFKDQLELEL